MKIKDWLNHDTRVRYVLEFGIDVPGEGRVCAAESGPYLTRRGAFRVGMRLLGKPAIHALVERNGAMYDARPRDMRHPIVGFTINAFTNASGTVDNYDFDKED